MNIFSQLQHMENATRSEKEVIRFILNDPRQFLELSSTEICSHCYVSVSTIYRLCEKLGISGLSQLKVKVSGSLEDYESQDEAFDFNYPIQQAQTQYEIIRSLQMDYEQTIQQTLSLFDLQELQKATAFLHKAEGIDVYASAGNLFFAQNFQFQMMEIGVEVRVPEDEYMQRLCAASSSSRRCAIVISFGGRGAAVKGILRNLKSSGTPVILISSPQAKSLDEKASHLYFADREEHSDKISSFSTRMSLLYILDVLYACYFRLHYDENKEKKKRYYQRLTGKESKKAGT